MLLKDSDMGWKMECIVVNEGDPGYLGTYPKHNHDRANELVKQLDLAADKFIEAIDFQRGKYPPNSSFCIGAYDKAMIFSDRNICGSVEKSTNPLLHNIRTLFPTASLLVIELHSVVNHFGYALYENGRLERAYGGDGDHGIVIDEGTIQPEEKSYFDKSIIHNGNRIFTAEINGREEKFDPCAFGEELVFAMSARFFGERLDSTSFDFHKLEMDLFQKKITWKSFWPFKS